MRTDYYYYKGDRVRIASHARIRGAPRGTGTIIESKGLSHGVHGVRWDDGSFMYVPDENLEPVGDYNEDPEASVFERIQVKANSEGRVA